MALSARPNHLVVVTPSIQKRLQVITRQKRQFSHLSQILVPM